jgi:hypothetical protein
MGSRKNITKRRNKKIKGGLFFGLMGNKTTASPGDTTAIESKMKAEENVSNPAPSSTPAPTTTTSSPTTSATPSPTTSATSNPTTLPKERSWVNFLTFGIVGGKRRTLRKRGSRRKTR